MPKSAGQKFNEVKDLWNTQRIDFARLAKIKEINPKQYQKLRGILAEIHSDIRTLLTTQRYHGSLTLEQANELADIRILIEHYLRI